MFFPSLILLVCLLSVVFADDFGIPFNPTNFSRHNITSWDGTVLQALVFDSSNKFAKKKNPLLIFISSWAMNDIEYFYPAKQYCDDGYTVVSYTSRGFWGSSLNRGHPGDYINMGGPTDHKDVSAVIDWALKQTSGDPNRIGLQGISYGAGISLATSGKDPRIKSVVAMSGWVDIIQSFLGNGNSIKLDAVRVLQNSGLVTGSVSDDLLSIFQDYFHQQNLDYLKETLTPSGALTYLNGINQNKPALFMANAYGDSLFTPNQFPSFYNSLIGPKHLEFSPGDHAGPELSGLFPLEYTPLANYMGQPGLVWMRSKQWNDYYLKNASTGVMPSMSPIVLNTANPVSKNNLIDIEEYSTWEGVSNKAYSFSLSDRENMDKTRFGDFTQQTQPKYTLSTSSSSSFSSNSSSSLETEVASFTADNQPLSINGGFAFITATVQANVDEKTFKLSDIDRKHAAVFQNSPHDFTTQEKIRGVCTVSLRVQSSVPDGMLVVYLLDMPNTLLESQNKGRLVSFAPVSYTNVIPGKTFSLEFELTLISWNLPYDHNLALVIGTHDKLFLDTNLMGQKIRIMSGSEFILPVHK